MRRFAVLLLCLCLVSCEGKKFGDYPPNPASGQVLINGKPAARVMLAFYLDDYKGDKSVVPQASTDSEGRFVLSTYSANDGAPAGDYHVSARWKPSGGGIRSNEDKLKGKYADPKASGLTAHIEKGNNELKPFELKAEDDAHPPQRTGKSKVFKDPPSTSTTP